MVGRTPASVTSGAPASGKSGPAASFDAEQAKGAKTTKKKEEAATAEAQRGSILSPKDYELAPPGASPAGCASDIGRQGHGGGGTRQRSRLGQCFCHGLEAAPP